MPVASTRGQGNQGRSPLWVSGVRAVTVIAFTGVLAAPLVGIAAAQTGSLGSSGSSGSGVTTPPTTTPPTTTTPTTTTPTPVTQATVELRVLVLDDGQSMVGAIADRLVAEGVEIDRRPITDARITREMLADDASRTARYMGIVSPQAARTGLSDAEDATLSQYAADYGVREVAAYGWPGADVGLSAPTYNGSVDGATVDLSPAATSGDWSYLDGSLTLDDLDPNINESWGYAATPAPGASFQPILTTSLGGASGVLMGVHTEQQRERLIMTIGMNRYQQHFKVLSHGIVSWLTRGVSTSLYRNIFSVHIDDVFLTDGEWNAEANCTPGGDCDPVLYPEDAPGASSRMNASDVSALTTWEDANGIELDMTFNAFGAAPTDPLTRALLAAKDDLRWINHTWSHTNLDAVSRAEIESQITRNLDWARDNRVPLDPTELVTGEHSGLRSGPAGTDNPALAPALDATGVKWVATDNSREQAQRRVGGALTVPRHPMNIYYNTSTEANAVDEYNWIYTSAADGGSGSCTGSSTSTCISPLNPATGFDSYIVPQEARFALGHALDMDPRPHYAHQSNLTNDRILYPVLDRMISSYRGLFSDSAPLVNASHSESGEELRRRGAWSAAAADVSASVKGNRLVITNSGSSAVTVPVTTPAASTLAVTGPEAGYAGARSGWISVGAGQSVTVTLASEVGFRTPSGTSDSSAAAARSLPRSTAFRATAGGTVELPPVNEATTVGALGVYHTAIG